MQTQLIQEEQKTKFTLSCVYLYFSQYCNLSCRHCWIDPQFSTDKTPKKDEIDIKTLLLALDECRRLGTTSVKITGGEPFLRSDIFELLDYIKSNKLKLNIESNATLIREKEAQALKEAGVNQVAVSLDGPDAQTHEALRGIKGSFLETLEGIKFLKKQDLNIQVIICLWRKNKDYIKSTIDLARSLGANSVKINVITHIARADKMAKENEVLSTKEIIDFYRQLMEGLKKGPPFNVTFDIPPAFYPLVNGQLKDLCTCGIMNILGILGDGKISICGIGGSLETLVLGRIGQDRIEDVWNRHPILEEIRKNVPHNLKGVCGKCILRFYCLGKCRAEAFYTQGSLLAPLSFCQEAYDQGLFPLSRLQGEVQQEKYIKRNNCLIYYSDNGSIITCLSDGKDYVRLKDFESWLWNKLESLEKISISELKSETKKCGILKDTNNLEEKINELVKKNIFLYVEDKKDSLKETKIDSQKLNKYKAMRNAIIEELNSAKNFGKEEDLEKFHRNSIETIDRHFETKEITVSFLYREDNPALRGLNYGERLLDEITKFKKIKKSTKILEVGAGLGFGSKAFLKSLKEKQPSIADDINYIFCDLTFKFLENQRNLTNFYPAEFIQANAETPPFKDNSFDIIIANEIIADFTAVKLSKKVVLDFLNGRIEKEKINDPSIKKALEWIKSSSIDINDALPEFIFNLGAFEFMRQINRLLKPNGIAFISEYGFFRGYPRAVFLSGHTEYTIQFSQLIKCIRSLGLDVECLSLLDFFKFDKEEEIVDTCSLNFLYGILKNHNIDLPYLAYTKEMLKEEIPKDLFDNFKGLKFRKIRQQSVCHDLNSFYVLLLKKGE